MEPERKEGMQDGKTEGRMYGRKEKSTEMIKRSSKRRKINLSKKEGQGKGRNG